MHAEHETVVSKGGFGVPTLVFDDGQALFGPVLVNPPTGARRRCACGSTSPAGSSSPTSTSCNGPRAPADIDTIATAFAPYLEARDWFSVQRDTP